MTTNAPRTGRQAAQSVTPALALSNLAFRTGLAEFLAGGSRG